jgi:hypothetical protein
LWTALDEDFVEVVEGAFDRLGVRGIRCEEMEVEADENEGEIGIGIREMEVKGEEERLDGRDIWAWWMFGLEWRSRRRVWYCAIQGCATARDADWW